MVWIPVKVNTLRKAGSDEHIGNHWLDLFHGWDIGAVERKLMAIRIKKKNQGKLRRSTKTKKGKNIPVSKLQALKKSKNPKTRKRATFALNARKWKKK